MQRTLSPESLRRRCDPGVLGFETTDALPDLDEPFGQARAIEALRFGIAMRHPDYHLFAIGPEGIGRHGIVRATLEQAAATRPVPDDWCYVHDFADRNRPRALRLPPGRGRALASAVATLVEELKAAIPALFESDELRQQKQVIESEIEKRHESELEKLAEEGRARGIGLVRTQAGFGFAPLRDGAPMSIEAFKQLSEAEQERYNASLAELDTRLKAVLERMPTLQRELRARVRDLVRGQVARTVAQLVDHLQDEWTAVPDVVAWLEELQQDVAEHAELFAGTEDGRSPLGNVPSPLGRYSVNVLVDRAGAVGAPVLVEDLPTAPALIGRIEHLSILGALTTDFTLIRPGALHQANGGYLVVDAFKLLTSPFAWEELKRVLRSRCIRIEALNQSMSFLSTVSLEPQPIPLDVKVVLVGSRSLYYLLSAADPQFSELFKVPADFGDHVDWTEGNVAGLARTLATIARRLGMRPLTAGAVARVVEQAARIVDDAARLSVHQQWLHDLVREADHFAELAGAASITEAHVDDALIASVRRADRIRDLALDAIARGVHLISLSGSAVGQINGLSLTSLGAFRFGTPVRITARSRMGSGQLVDITREVDLGGPIHSKGVLILRSYLAARYAPDLPLSLSASLVFEQSYGPVEGDSASLAELLALLSSLSDTPLEQRIAVTGAVDQHGRVLPIGGVNDKIEGFYDVASMQPANGTGRGPFGVVIPASNVGQLMLRRDVVAAVADGRFGVWAVETVSDALALFTGLPAEEVDRRVEARLAKWARASRRDQEPEPSGDPSPP